MTKLVLFDCDGVLINTEELGYRILTDMLAQEGLSYTREDYVKKLSGVGYKAFFKNLRQDYKEEKGKELPHDFEKNLSLRFLAAQEIGLKALDGIKELLQKLRAHNIPFAVCSNSGAESLLRKLKKAGLYEDFVPHIYSKHHVENGKPAPDIYLHAAKIRKTEPKDCLVIEDSVTGTMAGIAAGMCVLGFVGEDHREASEAEMLLKAGASMIALNPAQIWDHIVRFVDITPKSPSKHPMKKH